MSFSNKSWNLEIGASRLTCRSLQRIDSEVQQINGKLLRLAALEPDVASLSPLDYDTSKRSDPELLQRLVAHAKLLRVCEHQWLLL